MRPPEATSLKAISESVLRIRNPVKGHPSGRGLSHNNGGDITEDNKELSMSDAYVRLMKDIQPTLDVIRQSYSGMLAVAETLSGIREAMRPVMETIYATEETRRIISQAVNSYAESIRPVLRSSAIAYQNMSMISKAISSSIPKYDFSGIIKVSEVLSGINFNKLSLAAQSVLEENDWSDDEDAIERFAEKVCEAYVADTEEEQHVIEEIKTVTTTQPKELTTEEKALRQSYIQTVLNVLSILIAIYFGIASMNNKIEIPETTINNVQYVNNYYIENGYDKDFLNDCGLRIVNQEIKPRIKPDCSSRVTGTLEPGAVVSVTDKYKKWIWITWTNEDGDYVSGWIQNYKVSEFTK